MIRISGTASKRRNGGDWRTQGDEEEDRRELGREKELDHHTEWQSEYRNVFFYFTTPFSIYHTTHTLTQHTPFSFITCPCIYLIEEDLSHKRACHMPMAFATGLTGLSHLRRLVTTMSRGHTVAHGGIEADRSH